MDQDRCPQCEEHADLHKGNWLGIGQPNEPCEPCENHARHGCDPNRPRRSWW